MNRSKSAVVALILVPILGGMHAAAQTELTPHPGNPVLTGDFGRWDASTVRFPDVVQQGGTIWLFYSGSRASGAQSIGLAWSTDGVSFTKDYANNPILQPSSSGWDSGNVAAPGALLDSTGTWHIYYAGSSTPLGQPPPDIGRAVSSTGPSGPYTKHGPPVLSVGSPGDWDEEYCHPGTVIETAPGIFWLFYSGGAAWPPTDADPGFIGVAFSSDYGVTWQKYDDPSTRLAPYANSDPILRPGDPGNWDDLAVAFPGVSFDGVRWHMFYRGWDNNNGPFDYGYASSIDGLSWVRHPGNPVLTSSQQPWWTSDGLLGASILPGPSGYSVYYGGLTSNGAIGVAFGPETEDVFLDATPETVRAGVSLSFDTWQGLSGDPAILFLTAIDGSPFGPWRVVGGSFDASGIWLLDFSVPPGLGVHDLTFRTFAKGRITGKVVMTNEETVQFR